MPVMVGTGQGGQGHAARGHQHHALARRCPTCRPSSRSGVPDYEMAGWFGILAPAGTPPAIAQRLRDEVAKAVAAPDVVSTLASQGMEPLATQPRGMGRLPEIRTGRLYQDRQGREYQAGITEKEPDVPEHARWRSGHRRLSDPREGALRLRPVRPRQHRVHRRAVRALRRDQDHLGAPRERRRLHGRRLLPRLRAADGDLHLLRSGLGQPADRARQLPISIPCRSWR